MQELLRGSLAGLIATAPMTWTMKAADRLLPRRHQGRLPPRQITESVLESADARQALDEEQLDALTVVAHYGFGTAAGALLGLTAARMRWPGPLAGAGVGLAVWAGSYLGWLPATRLRRSATQEPAPRNLQMIAAHLVWGAAAGALLDALSPRRP